MRRRERAETGEDARRHQRRPTTRAVADRGVAAHENVRVAALPEVRTRLEPRRSAYDSLGNIHQGSCYS